MEKMNLTLTYIVLLFFLTFSVQITFSYLKNLFQVIDLNYVQEICEDHGIKIDDEINQVNVCLHNIPNNLHAPDHVTTMVEESTGMSPVPSVALECKYATTYLACYKMAAEILNRCEPGRGDVLQAIHSTLHSQLICENDGARLQEAYRDSKDEDCVPKFDESEECNSDNAYANWESSDICTSFKALLSCQESALSSASCSPLKLTKLIVQKLRTTGLLLNCFPNAVEEFQDPILVGLFPTPSEELTRIHGECEAKGIKGIIATREQVQECFKNEKIADITNPCERIQPSAKCWKLFESKINECVPHRGTIVTQMYVEMLKASCEVKDKLKSLSKEQRCTRDGNSVESCTNADNPNSDDICKSFHIKEKCVEDSIRTCTSKVHQDLITAQLEQVENALRCEHPEHEENTDGHHGHGASTSKGGVMDSCTLAFVFLIMISVLNN